MLGRDSDNNRAGGQPSENPRRERPLSTLPIVFTVMGDRAKIEGKFEIPNSIRVECEIEGELKVGRKLIVGESGVVNADVQTVDAVIAGTYHGNLQASGTVEIESTGCVSGTIEADGLVIAPGAAFTGTVKRNREADTPARPVNRLENALAANHSNGS